MSSGMSISTVVEGEAGDGMSAAGDVLDDDAKMSDDVRYFKRGWDCGFPTGWREAERWHGVSPADAEVVSGRCGAEESAV